MTANGTPARVAPTVRIAGRVSSASHWPLKNPTRYTVLVRLPAADEYTTPATVEVTSEKPLPQVGEHFDKECTVSGRYRSYPVTDKQTGEIRTVATADNTLTVA